MTNRFALATAAAALALLAQTGCSKAKDPAAALLGTWTLDLDVFKQSDDYKGMPEAQQKMAEGMFAAMKAEFTFTADKVKVSMEMMGQKRDEESSYVVKKAEAGTLTLESTDKDGTKQEVEVTIEGERLVFVQGPKKKFYLKRKL